MTGVLSITGGGRGIGAASARLAAAVAMNRIAGAEEIARPILWLLSEAASFVSGTCLDAAGGFVTATASKA